jgi:hypothetical protein
MSADISDWLKEGREYVRSGSRVFDIEYAGDVTYDRLAALAVHFKTTKIDIYLRSCGGCSEETGDSSYQSITVRLP